MTPVIVPSVAPLTHRPVSYARSRKQEPIRTAKGVTFCAELPPTRRDARTGSGKKRPGAPAISPRGAGRVLVLAGVLAGTVKPRRLARGTVARRPAEPPAAACVFSGSAAARSAASTLFFGSTERPAACAPDFFYESATLPQDDKRLDICILQSKNDRTRSRFSAPRKRPHRTLQNHG
jgi:hypothetical protein